jgi:sialate O-acetylesterase
MGVALRAAALLLGATLTATAAAEARLAGIFGEHMVLQRQAPVPVWGTALAGEAVRVTLHGRTRATRAGADGRWQVELPAVPAGGPYTLRVQATHTLELKDVLVGDVWLCAGQSNMEWPLAQSQGAAAELAAASHPTIRHLKIAHRASLAPQADIEPAPWQPSTPASAGQFSAVAYFFAVHLQKQLGAAAVPIGLVNASWGGSHIETWTSRSAALADPVLASVVGAMPGDDAGFVKLHAQRERAAIQRWQGDLPLPAGDTLTDVKAAWSAPALDDAAWPTLNAPQVWEEQGLPTFDGALWLRREVLLTPEQAAGAAQLQLGMIDDCDETWVNGQRVGGLCPWDAQRRYTLATGVLHAGRNLIAVRVVDTGGGGGFHGEPAAMRLDTAAGSLPLHGPWKARVEAPLTKTAPGFNDLPTLLFNGMLQPLTPLRLRGVLWYQGESNVPRAARYAQDLQRLITDWRAQWHQPRLPILYVQLAAFLPLERNTLRGSAWAELRDAQRQALALPATGMVVATDVGDAKDIHPRRKREVGERLAALALRQAYGRKGVVASGPRYRGLDDQAEGRIALRFDELGNARSGGLAVRGGGNSLAGFAIAGADQRFMPARARVEGRRVVVWSPLVEAPVAVRYGWVDNPEQATLINRAGLPASPFRTDRWPLLTEGARPTF